MKKRGRRRKKGRPSLADLQKRALLMQQDSDANPSPTAIAGPVRRSARRSSFRFPRDEDDEDEGSGGRKRKEKQLDLVLGSPLEDGLQGLSWDEPSVWGEPVSMSDGERNGGIGACGVGGNGSEKGEPEFPSSFRDAGNLSQGEPSDSGPRTPLPDKKLLMLTLDRLQKKDKYRVYSDPVDPNELPDYHEIIENPMDFSTIRKKLCADAYTYLEDFEKDVFLISSNAMTYNAPSTIYFRQARSIEELAKKCFENLRQGGNDDDLEHKLVRRGRPPGKNSSKKPIGRPPTKHMLDFSNALLGDTSSSYLRSVLSSTSMENGLALDKTIGTGFCFQNLHSSENMSWLGSHTSARIEPLSGQGNTFTTSEENGKNTHEWSMPHESHILNAMEGEKKLIPVGFHTQHAYARSLARFAANLGPIGWKIAAKRIEKALPPGTRFGPGWIGEDEAPKSNHRFTPGSSSAPMLSSKADSSHETLDRCSNQEPSSTPGSVKLDGKNARMLVGDEIQPPVVHLQKPQMQNVPNGFYEPYAFQSGIEVKESTLTRCWNLEVPMTHAQALEMVSRRSASSFVHPASTNHKHYRVAVEYKDNCSELPCQKMKRSLRCVVAQNFEPLL